MIRASDPSFVKLPSTGSSSPGILDFLDARFNKVGRSVWRDRIASGKVLDNNFQPITLETAYVPCTRLYYFREISREPKIPFTEEIVFQNHHLLVACKPHFLPVTPAGNHIQETLLYRLRKSTGNRNLSPINRIDKNTAGIVLFSLCKETRPAYQNMFRDRNVYKAYEAVCLCARKPVFSSMLVENRMVPGEPSFRMKIVDGPVNARTNVSLVETRADRALFHLEPLTGKKHQLRVHLCHIGYPVMNDNYYPDLLSESDTDFSKPLQLLAQKVRFIDPLTKKEMEFVSQRRLGCF